MSTAHDWLRADEVELDARLPDKRAVLNEVSRLFAARLGADCHRIFDALSQRESLGSTALGRGIALPHARLPGLAAPLGATIRLQQAIAFDAPDDKPVDFVLALLLPTSDPRRQLDLLAALATRFSEPGFHERAFGAADASALRKLLTDGVSA